jgi:hypothetical protein
MGIEGAIISKKGPETFATGPSEMPGVLSTLVIWRLLPAGKPTIGILAGHRLGALTQIKPDFPQFQ